ncbi:hypothetical protein MVEN_00804200 [Mycena venus]|uniref:Uncharacterized protein n=1 Tax=Mycena venus TaxID=2733690 RepID=A0A8H6YGD8_9AGAR|nr:hypothetical protein MVEN_00804200 [Mycena venus]
MNNQRPYYAPGSGSGNIPYSSYSSLADAGMSYVPAKQQFKNPHALPSQGDGMGSPGLHPWHHSVPGYNSTSAFTASYTPGLEPQHMQRSQNAAAVGGPFTPSPNVSSPNSGSHLYATNEYTVPANQEAPAPASGAKQCYHCRTTSTPPLATGSPDKSDLVQCVWGVPAAAPYSASAAAHNRGPRRGHEKIIAGA